MFENLSFESERLTTAPLTAADATVLFEIYADREAMKYRGSPPLEKLEDARRMIATSFTSDATISKRRVGIRHKEVVLK